MIELPAKPPAVSILYPTEAAQVYGDALIHLWGTASSFGGGEIDPQRAEWFIDDQPVGQGLDLWVPNPGAGRHRVRLQVSDGALSGEAVSEIEVVTAE